MEQERFLDILIEKMIENGSSKEELEKIRKQSLLLLKNSKDKTPVDVIEELLSDLECTSEKFLHSMNQSGIQNVSALSTCIYLPDFVSGGYKVKVIGGKTTRLNDGVDIDSSTLFDLASITKLFALLLTFKLEEYHFFDIHDKIEDLCPYYKGQLEDYTIMDILRLCGEYRTDPLLGNIRDVSSEQQAWDILRSTRLVDNDRSRNKYNDWGPMILSDVITYVMNEKMGTHFHYDDIMNEYLLKPFGLYQTMYHPTKQVVGNGNRCGFPHDAKARNLHQAVGHAGLFSNSEDLARLALEMFRVKYVNYDACKHLVSQDHLKQMGSVTFPDSEQCRKGLLGIYLHGFEGSFAPASYSKSTFAHQGWTGPVAIFDYVNMIHNNILVSAVKEECDERVDGWGKNDKPDGFIHDYYFPYQEMVVQCSLKMLIVKKYFDRISREDNVVIKSRILR